MPKASHARLERGDGYWCRSRMPDAFLRCPATLTVGRFACRRPPGAARRRPGPQHPSSPGEARLPVVLAGLLEPGVGPNGRSRLRNYAAGRRARTNLSMEHQHPHRRIFPGILRRGGGSFAAGAVSGWLAQRIQKLAQPCSRQYDGTQCPQPLRRLECSRPQLGQTRCRPYDRAHLTLRHPLRLLAGLAAFRSGAIGVPMSRPRARRGPHRRHSHSEGGCWRRTVSRPGFRGFGIGIGTPPSAVSHLRLAGLPVPRIATTVRCVTIATTAIVLTGRSAAASPTPEP